MLSDFKLLKKRIIEYMAAGVKPAYYNNKLVYLRIFFNWCIEEKLLSENPLAGFKRQKTDGRIVKLEDNMLKNILNMPDQKTYAGLRDYALLLLHIDTGIRPKEALSLLLEDINLSALEVYVKAENAKTRVARTLPISAYTVKAIKKLINTRPDYWSKDAPVFSSCEGVKLSVNGWYKRLSGYGHKIEVNIFPYQLRHHFALSFLKNGGDAFSLQRTLGHADMSMTNRYVFLADDDIKKQHDIASPVTHLMRSKAKLRRTGGGKAELCRDKG